MAPQDVPILILGTWHTLPHVAKGLLDVTEDLELQRLSWFLQKGHCNHEGCPERGVGRSRVMEERVMEAETGDGGETQVASRSWERKGNRFSP